MSIDYKYAAANEASIYESVDVNKGKKLINKILMGTYAAIVSELGDFYQIVTAGPDGWIKKSNLSDNMGLKMFYLNVGQGDAVLIECGNLKILVDAGPNNNLYGYLTKYQYTYLLNNQLPVHFDYVFISHFDTDNYKGIIKILDDKRFTFGTICHPGILKFASGKNQYNSGLGNTVKVCDKTWLTTVFDDLCTINDPELFNRDISNFLDALKKAHAENRIGNACRLKAGEIPVSETIENNVFKIEVLAPFDENVEGKIAMLYWEDDGQTINGHSLVLKITFGKRTFLLEGDLNSNSEKYLIQKYSTGNTFEADVAKSCHHGSSDFTVEFMACVNPYATVISSGDNEGHAHPRADAIGCAGKYAKGSRPLVYSTEIARSVNLKNNEILFGMVNLRCNGKDIYMSQMKEVKKNTDLWDSYKLPL